MIKKGVFIFFIFCVFFVFPLQSFAVKKGKEKEKAHKPRINISGLEIRVHELINAERRKAGLRPLAMNRRLSAIAREHSRDMALRNYFSHITPEGEDPLARYKKNGFECSIQAGSRIYLGAENIFQNNLYSSVEYMNGKAYYNWDSLEEIARSTVKGWMQSPGHRRNILTRAFRSEGIGIAVKNGKVYITQDFC